VVRELNLAINQAKGEYLAVGTNITTGGHKGASREKNGFTA